MFAHFAEAATLFANGYIFLAIAAGTVLGLIFGSLPGLTATMGIALLLPLTFGMEPVTGMGMLLGVYCGAISGARFPLRCSISPVRPRRWRLPWMPFPWRATASRVVHLGCVSWPP